MEKEKNRPGTNPSPELLAALCRKHGVDLTPDQVSKLWAFHSLLRKRNPELNMTRIHKFETMVVKHYVDSMIVASLVDLPSPLLDIGTGAGFPAIPLKILRPDLKLILAEGRKKRVAFLEEAIALLELEDVEIAARKIERDFSLPVAGVITRALEKAGETLRRVTGCLQPGGLAVFMKGPHCDEEADEAVSQYGDDYELAEKQAYTLTGTPHKRKLLIFRRKQAPPHFVRQALEISSASNRTYRSFQNLLSAKGIRKAGQALLSGKRIIEETLRDHAALCKGWIHHPDQPPPPFFARGKLTGYCLTQALFKELDTHGTHAPLLHIDLPEIVPWSPEQEALAQGCTLFIPFQDPENVGSVIRSAAAFGVSRVVLLEEAAHPFLPKACRAAGGALLKVPLFSGPPLESLQTNVLPLLTLSPSGQDLRKFRFPRSFGLLAGLEGKGLPEKFRTGECLSIPMQPGCESLNAAASVSVALYAWNC